MESGLSAENASNSSSKQENARTSMRCKASASCLIVGRDKRRGAEIAEQGLPFCAMQNIVRVQIAMHDALRVQVFGGRGNAERDADAVFRSNVVSAG